MRFVVFFAIVAVAWSTYENDIYLEESMDAGARFEEMRVIPEPDFDTIAKYARKFLAESYHGVLAETIRYNYRDYYIVDIRDHDSYCAGHIPGAVNVKFHDLVLPENLAKYPKDRKMLIYCYTGHTASQSTAILNLLGYDAYTLQFAILSWRKTSQVTVWNTKSTETITGADYELETC